MEIKTERIKNIDELNMDSFSLKEVVDEIIELGTQAYLKKHN